MSGIYFLYDELAEKAAPVFQAPSDAVAIRQCMVTLQDVPEVIRNDLKLYKLGEFHNAGLYLETEEGSCRAFPIGDIKDIISALNKDGE